MTPARTSRRSASLVAGVSDAIGLVEAVVVVAGDEGLHRELLDRALDGVEPCGEAGDPRLRRRADRPRARACARRASEVVRSSSWRAVCASACRPVDLAVRGGGPFERRRCPPAPAPARWRCRAGRGGRATGERSVPPGAGGASADAAGFSASRRLRDGERRRRATPSARSARGGAGATRYGERRGAGISGSGWWAPLRSAIEESAAIGRPWEGRDGASGMLSPCPTGSPSPWTTASPTSD